MENKGCTLKKSSVLTAGEVAAFRKEVRRHFQRQGRDLSWRRDRTPYRVFVSEIMLQQTQVGRVTEKFPFFLAVFTDFASLAAADTRRLLSVWKGMGYNRRALSLRDAAKMIVKQFGGTLPAAPESLDTLPGVGKATAASIAVFAFNRPVAFIETNVRRVFIHRFFKDRTDVHDDEIMPLVERTIDRKRPAAWYDALMDYGAALAKDVPNPNRRSSHYQRQSPFAGSARQKRGAILGLLVGRTAMDREKIARVLKIGRKQLLALLEGLEREGFIVGDAKKVRIR